MHPLLRGLLAPIRYQPRRCMGSGGHGKQELWHLKTAHMDMMPIPHGSWQEGFKKKQQLIYRQMGIAALATLSWVVGLYAFGMSFTTSRPNTISFEGDVTKNPPHEILTGPREDEFVARARIREEIDG